MIKKHIPNAITLLNLACGCLAILYVLEGKYNWVFLLVGISLIADFADGLVARALNVKSELGKQLDSLADATTFGVLPGIILYVLLGEAFGIPLLEDGTNIIQYQSKLLRIEHAGLLYSVFAIYRLGKFNIDERQTINFIGLATPAAALFVLGLLMIYQYQVPFFYDLIGNGNFLLITTGVLAALMVSEIPMFSFKLDKKTLKGNEIRIGFLVLCIPVIIIFKWAAMPLVVLLYILASVLHALIYRKSEV